MAHLGPLLPIMTIIGVKKTHVIGFKLKKLDTAFTDDRTFIEPCV